MHTVAAVFEMGFDFAYKHHVLPMPVYETEKFCPHYGEVVILSGVFDTNWHGTFHLCQFLKFDKSHHQEAVTTLRTLTFITIMGMAIILPMPVCETDKSCLHCGALRLVLTIA